MLAVEEVLNVLLGDAIVLQCHESREDCEWTTHLARGLDVGEVKLVLADQASHGRRHQVLAIGCLQISLVEGSSARLYIKVALSLSREVLHDLRLGRGRRQRLVGLCTTSRYGMQ